MKHTLKVSTPTDREIVLTRVFDAPRPLVWSAMTKPELLKRWLFGPDGWTMTVCDDEVRVGGKFHYAWSGPGGEAMSLRGVYREVAPPERVVRTESFEFGCDTQAGEQLARLVLTEEADKTYLTLTVLYPSREARDGTLASGMEHGVGAGYDRLDAILAAME
ncbi:MAG TPA: SRPBCC family protein [Planctomycetaceae bacterium]|jgi:uncharacterized protein YndB with AHSA1/START domain|nr:SRPBCC family protein [Planctomycetaceae bacterium]